MFKKIDFNTIGAISALIILGVVGYILRDEIFDKPKDNLYEVEIKNFRGIDSLVLTGQVYNINDGIRGYHGRGILRVNIIETNIEYYDPRDKQANYYCIIKNGKAEVYESDLAYVEIGDTISIDIKKRHLYT